jgi:hypothetical protein
MLTNPERLAEYVKAGDCVMDVVNRAVALLNPASSLPLPAGTNLPWNAIGVLVYDND